MAANVHRREVLITKMRMLVSTVKNPVSDVPWRPQVFRDVGGLTAEDYRMLADHVLSLQSLSMSEIKKFMQQLKVTRLAYFHLLAAPGSLVHPKMSMPFLTRVPALAHFSLFFPRDPSSGQGTCITCWL